MDLEQLNAEAPDEVRGGTHAPPVRYELARDLVAFHGHRFPGATVVDEEEDISVQPGDEAPTEVLEGAVIGPVYRSVPGGGVAVPTGRALVRFGEGELAERHRDRLAAAGYELEEVLPYAPHAVWVRAKSRRITDALKHLERLEALPGVENVEPQMISQRARKA